MSSPGVRVPGLLEPIHPAILGRRVRDGLELTSVGLVCVGIALAIALEMPKPNYALVLGGVFSLLAVSALITSSRLDLTAGGLVFFLGCINGPLKLISSTGTVGSAVQDVLIVAIVLGLLLRHLVSGRRQVAAALGMGDRVRRAVAVEVSTPKRSTWKRCSPASATSCSSCPSSSSGGCSCAQRADCARCSSCSE